MRTQSIKPTRASTRKAHKAAGWPPVRGIRADRLFDQLWPNHAFPSDSVARELGAANHFAQELPIDFAGDDDGFQIEQCDGDRDRHRDGGTRRFDPTSVASHMSEPSAGWSCAAAAGASASLFGPSAGVKYPFAGRIEFCRAD